MRRTRVIRPFATLTVLFVAALFVSLASLGVGAVRLSPADVVQALVAQDAPGAFIVWEYRLPRIVLAWILGMSLAVSGAVIQGVIKNLLAAPEVMGVTGGAGLAAAALLLAFPGIHLVTVPLGAFVGGMAAAGLVYALAYRRGVSPGRLALVGVAVGAACNSGLNLLITRFPVEVNVALTWLAGSLWGRGWSEVWSVLPWFLLLAPVTYTYARRLDILALGDDMATGLGESVERVQFVAVFAAVALASSSVAVGGTIAFVGLVAPHIARQLVGERHQALIPASGIVGALLLVVADAVGRGLLAPLEIPAGLITAVIGVPYFLYLIRRVK